MPGDSVTSQTPLKVYSITDFTAGIVSSTNAPRTTPRVPNSGQSTTFSTNTYGCYGLPTGGLLLGPTPYATDTPTISIPSGMVENFVAGVAREDGFISSLGDYPYIIVINGRNTSTGDAMVAVYTIAASTPPVLIAYFTAASAVTALTMAFPFITTLTDGTNYQYEIIFTIFGSIAFSYYVELDGSGASMSAPAALGIAIPANGRVWFITPSLPNANYLNSIDYTGPTIASSGDNRTFPSGTGFPQQTLVDYDSPSSFGAWGAISSANFLLVKSGGGGIIVTGDIYDPTITRAPAVQGTNGLIGQAALTPLGLIYRSYNRGVWVWDGSAASTKISQSINDFEFDMSAKNYFGNISYVSQPYPTFPNTVYNIQYICSMVFVDGGFFYDPVTSAWWKLPPYTSSTLEGRPPIFYMENGVNWGSFSTSAFVSNVFTTVYYSFDVSEPTSKSETYSFDPPPDFYGSFLETNPINLASDDIVSVQEISIILQGTGSLTVNCLGIQGVTLTSKTIPVTNDSFARVSIVTSFETDVLILQLGWTNSHFGGNSTPIIANIELQYRERFPVIRV